MGMHHHEVYTLAGICHTALPGAELSSVDHVLPDVLQGQGQLRIQGRESWISA